MSEIGDPADKVLDAAADGAFGGKHDAVNRRAGYGDVEYEGRTYTKLEWLLRAAKRGDCLPWGDAAKVVAYYEAELARLHSLLAMENDPPLGCEEEE